MMVPPRLFILFIAINALGMMLVSSAPAEEIPSRSAASPEQIEHFEKKIRPLLVAHCYSCHSEKAEVVHGSFKLDTASGLAAGGDCGPSIDYENPAESLLLGVIRYEDDAVTQMPPKGKMQDEEIALLTDWILQGAPYPPSQAGSAGKPQKIDMAAAKTFWSFQPVEEQSLPKVQQLDWPRQRLDHFVLAAIEREGLKPAAEADKSTLFRRLCYDLTGLPPSPEQMAQFLQDESADAYERQVDRLIDSPQFGERWARLWLDLARYTDKTASWLNSTGNSYMYRDWVVRAMNEDMPYDQFIHRQLATDLMPETGPEDMAALGYLGLSPTYWKELQLPPDIIKVIVADEWEERVDAVSQTFLGLTVACARCHDHKFDPITMQDYYALAGVFASTRMAERPLIPEEQFAPIREARAKVAELEKEIQTLKKQKPQPEEKIADLTAQIQELKSTPDYNSPMVPAILEEYLTVEPKGETPQDGTNLVYRPGSQDLQLFIRGNPNRLGEVVPRRFLEVLSAGQPRRLQNGSGRLDLAQAITNEAAPLTARVMVNRIWVAYFGRGLVTTPSNFGFSGDAPTHPELLEDLAARFIANGWSLKQLHRELVLSATYRQSSRGTAESLAADPDNHWFARMNRKRLTVESWRDAMLSVTGELDTKLGGESLELTSPENVRRTLYGTIHRREMSTMLLMHDFPDPASHSPGRVNTTTALQGLFALNSPLLLDRAAALTQRLQNECPERNTDRITRAYELLFARQPTDRELQLGLQFLGETTGEAQQAAWSQYAHVLLASNEFLYVD